MCIENLDELSQLDWYSVPYTQTIESNKTFHESIFQIDPCKNPSFNRRAVLHNDWSELEQRTETSYKTSAKSGGQVSVEIKVEWGGDRVNVSGGAKAEAHDDNGNYGEFKVEIKDDGTGSATASGGHKEEG